MRNLQAEIKRFGLSNSDIQKVLGCSEKTARNKIHGETEFTITEAFRVRDTLFPGSRMEYLFAQDDNTAERAS